MFDGRWIYELSVEELNAHIDELESYQNSLQTEEYFLQRSMGYDLDEDYSDLLWERLVNVKTILHNVEGDLNDLYDELEDRNVA